MHALEDLNAYNSRYIEDMTTVYKKCDQFEKDRLDFFIEKFLKLHSHLNIYEKMKYFYIKCTILVVIKFLILCDKYQRHIWRFFENH